jgi:hypothetical protein
MQVLLLLVDVLLLAEAGPTYTAIQVGQLLVTVCCTLKLATSAFEGPNACTQSKRKCLLGSKHCHTNLHGIIILVSVLLLFKAGRTCKCLLGLTQWRGSPSEPPNVR